MFKIKFCKSHELSIQDNDNQRDESSIPRWLGRKVIRVQRYNCFLGFILHFFGHAIKFQTAQNQFIYLKKPHLLQFISKDEEEQKRVFVKLMPKPTSVLKKENFVAELKQIYQNVQQEFGQIDNQLIIKTSRLNTQKLAWEKLEQVIQLISKQAGSETIQKKNLVKLKDCFNELKSHSFLETLPTDLTGVYSSLKNWNENDEIEIEQSQLLFVLCNKIKPYVENQITKSETDYVKSLNIINDKLKTLINHPKVIKSIPISQLQLLIQLEYLFLELGPTLTQLYRSKALMNHLKSTHEEHEKALNASCDPFEQLKKENHLIELFSHILENFSSLNHQDFAHQTQECKNYISAATDRVKILAKRLTTDQIEQTISATSSFRQNFQRATIALEKELTLRDTPKGLLI